MKKYLSLNYFRNLLQWTWKGKFHILSFLAVIITLLYLIEVINFYPDIVAGVLTIVGLFIILTQQFLDAKEFSDHKPKTVSNWSKSFPTLKPITITVDTGRLVLSSGKVGITTSISDDASVEEKINFLLRQVKHLQVLLSSNDNRVDNVANTVKEKSKELQTNLVKTDEVLKTIIAGHIVGAYDFNLFGIIITICGTLIQFFYTKTA